MNKIFPLGLASGAAFCNRSKERRWLADNIKQCRHTILLSPRRYGKTSLANQVFKEQDCLHVKFDLLLISDTKTLQKEIFNGVAKMAAQLLPLHKRGYEKLKKIMGAFKPELIIGDEGVKVKFHPNSSSRISISEALEKLDELAQTQKKKIVLFMDEFQQIATLKDHEIIEAAIRHAAERSQNICYIFSGSNRHLLAEMFQDSARPLYHLCEEMYVKRIPKEEYQQFIQSAAEKRWGKKLADAALEQIISLTQCHSYYINLLCSRLWRNKKSAAANLVKEYWLDYCEEQRGRIRSELAKLSPNQRAVIREIAKHPTATPTSKELEQKTRLAHSSVVQAIVVLKQKDFIYEDEDGVVRPLDPVVETLYTPENRG